MAMALFPVLSRRLGDAQLEFAALTGSLSLDDLEYRVFQPGGRFQIAHQGRDTRIRLSDALDGKHRVLLSDTGEIQPVWRGLHQFVEQVDDGRTVALQLLDDLHA